MPEEETAARTDNTTASPFPELPFLSLLDQQCNQSRVILSAANFLPCLALDSSSPTHRYFPRATPSVASHPRNVDPIPPKIPSPSEKGSPRDTTSRHSRHSRHSSFCLEAAAPLQQKTNSKALPEYGWDVWPLASGSPFKPSFHPSPFTLTLHPSPFTLHPSSFTRHPSPFLHQINPVDVCSFIPARSCAGDWRDSFNRGPPLPYHRSPITGRTPFAARATHHYSHAHDGCLDDTTQARGSPASPAQTTTRARPLRPKPLAHTRTSHLPPAHRPPPTAHRPPPTPTPTD
jgi:hypothetical protein